MSSLAVDLKSSANCGTDLQNENQIVQQAYAGLLAYDLIYRAGCLKQSSLTSSNSSNELSSSSDEQQYCFADAVTNASSTIASYMYYLPLGISLPSTAPTVCSTCVKNTMAIFAPATGNSTLPISSTYSSAAEVIDKGCGAHFVNASLAVKSGGLPIISAIYFGGASLAVWTSLILSALFVFV